MLFRSAGVLVTRPKFLLFDEPVAGLDHRCRDSFLRMISRLNEEGTTIVMVSHNADTIGDFAKRLIVLDNGTVSMDGTVSEVFADIDRLKALRIGVSTPRQLADLLAKLLAELLEKRGIAISQDIVSYNGLLKALQSCFAGRTV